MSSCGKCLDGVSDGVSCGGCRGLFHFPCAGLSESGYRRMGAEKRAAWRCASCSSRSSPAPAPDAIAALTKEVKAMRTELKSFAAQLQLLSDTSQGIKGQLTALEVKFSGFDQRLTVVEGKAERVSQLETQLEAANVTITSLSVKCNAQDQFSRLNNIEISGVPISKGENLFNIVHDVCVKVGVPLVDTDIDSVHRVRRFPASGPRVQPSGEAREPSIIVRLARRRRKDDILAAIRARRGLTTSDLGLAGPSRNIYLNDHLTPFNKQLLKRARELKVEFNYDYLWVRDCKIMLRKNDKSKNYIHVACESDLLKIK